MNMAFKQNENQLSIIVLKKVVGFEVTPLNFALPSQPTKGRKLILVSFES